MGEQRKICYLQTEVNRALQQILQYQLLNPQHMLRYYYIGTQKQLPDKTPSSFYPALFCVLQLLVYFQEMCFGIGAETWLSQLASTDELTDPITQSSQFSEANTLCSHKSIRSDLQGAQVETPSPLLFSPESPNTPPRKSSAESSTYRAQKQCQYRLGNEGKHQEL